MDDSPIQLLSHSPNDPPKITSLHYCISSRCVCGKEFDNKSNNFFFFSSPDIRRSSHLNVSDIYESDSMNSATALPASSPYRFSSSNQKLQQLEMEVHNPMRSDQTETLENFVVHDTFSSEPYSESASINHDVHSPNLEPVVDYYTSATSFSHSQIADTVDMPRILTINADSPSNGISMQDLTQVSSSPSTIPYVLKRKRDSASNIPIGRYPQTKEKSCTDLDFSKLSGRTRKIMERIQSLDVTKVLDQSCSKSERNLDSENSESLNASYTARNVSNRSVSDAENEYSAVVETSGQASSKASKISCLKSKTMTGKKKEEQERKSRGKTRSEKIREKELASLNKLKSSKKETCTEMIVDMDTIFAAGTVGQKLRPMLESFGIEVSTT